MNINPEQPAFPHEGSGMPDTIGISIRAHFASMAMQSMVHIGCMTESGTFSRIPEVIAKYAVIQADALITELNKETK